MSIKSKLKPTASKPFISDLMHQKIFEFESKLKYGDKKKIANQSGLTYESVVFFFNSPDRLSKFTFNEVYIAVEKYLQL